MANPNSADNTQLGSGELIANEAVDPNASKRFDAAPVVAYKLPRSKIAVGNYGQDEGDARAGFPLHVESVLERREAEVARLVSMQASFKDSTRYAGEVRNIFALDVRGQLIEHRGRR